MDEQSKKDLVERVEKALDLIRPALEADGGNVDLVDIDDNYVAHVKMMGHCGGCPMAQMTLKMGIERTLTEQVPEIKGVEAVPPESPIAH